MKMTVIVLDLFSSDGNAPNLLVGQTRSHVENYLSLSLLQSLGPPWTSHHAGRNQGHRESHGPRVSNHSKCGPSGHPWEALHNGVDANCPHQALSVYWPPESLRDNK